MAARSVGTIFAELDLDISNYTRSQKRLFKDATSTATDIETNFRKLGVKSAKEFDLLRLKATNSFEMIKNSAVATKDEIVRAEKKKNATLKRLDTQQFGNSKTMLQKLSTAYKTHSGKAIAAVKSIGRAAALAATAGLVATVTMVKKTADAYAEFEGKLVDMGKVTGESLEGIEKKVMGMPAVLGSVSELMVGYYNTISAGIKGEAEQLDFLTVSAKTAKSAHLDMGEVVKGLSKTMAGFEGEIRTAADAADLLFTIEKEGQSTVAELIPHIGSLAKQSRDLGVSQEELGGSLATMTQLAGTTSIAATQYKNVLKALSKPSSAMTEEFKKMGVSSGQAAIKAFGLSGTLQKLVESTGGSVEKMNKLFTEMESGMGVSALMAENFTKFNTKIEAMEGKAGSLIDAWEKYIKTLNAIKETFMNTIGKQAVLIGKILAPAVKDILGRMTAWLEVNKEMITMRIGEFLNNFIGNAEDLATEVYKLTGKFEGLFLFLQLTSKVLGYFSKNILHFISDVGKASAKITGLLSKLNVFSKTKPKVVVSLVGEGSSVKPLGEKITEMTGRMDDFSSHIEGLNPTMEAEMSPITQGLEKALTKARAAAQEMRHLGFAVVGQGQYEHQLSRQIAESKKNEQISTRGTYNINLAPTFMTGDSSAADNVAREIAPAIDRLNMRYGS